MKHWWLSGLILLLVGCSGSRVIPDQSLEEARANQVVVLYDGSSNQPPLFANLAQIHALFLQNLLGHFPNVRVQLKPVSAYKSGEAQRVLRTFYLGTTYDEPIPAALIKDLQAGAPITWMGANIWQVGLEKLGLEFKTYHVAYTPSEIARTFNRVSYRGYEFDKYPAPMEMTEMQVLDASRIEVLASANNPAGRSIPYAVRSGAFWLIADNPFPYFHATDRYLVLADLLGPMLGKDQKCQPRALLRLEDMSPADEASDWKAAMDVLEQLRLRFAVAVIPTYVNEAAGLKLNWNDVPEMKEQLLRIEKIGGRVFQHGYAHMYEGLPNPLGISGTDWEFWDNVREAPIPGLSPAASEGRVKDGLSILNKLGLDAVGWVTPHYEADPALYTVFDAIFSKAFERRMYRVGSMIAGQFFPYPLRDINKTQMLPENLGNIQEGEGPQNMIERAKANRVLRCPWIGLFIHPYLLNPEHSGSDKLTPDDLRKLIIQLQALGYEFVDPAGVKP